MLDRIKGRIAFICDECGDGLETDEYDFHDGLKFAKEQGWENIAADRLEKPPKRAQGQKWINICGDCKEYLDYK